MPRWSEDRRRLVAKGLVVAIWLTFAVIGVAKGLTHRTFDFGVFQHAGARFLEAAPLARIEEPLPFKYVPFTAVLFAPLGLLPEPVAAALWNVGSLLALAWVLARGLPRVRDGETAPFESSPDSALWIFAILAHALFFELSRGQADLLMLAAVTACVADAEARPWRAGFFGAVAIGLKLPALLLFVLLARWRRWQAALGIVVALAGLEALLFARYGWSAGLQVHAAWRAVLADTTTNLMMGTEGWIALVVLGTGIDPHLGIAALQGPLALGLTGLLVLVRARPSVWFAVLTLAMAGLSPLCWNPTWLMAVPALVFAFNAARQGDALGRMAVFGVGLAAAVGLTWLSPGILSDDTYQTILGRLRPYAWLSLALAAFVMARGRAPTEPAPAA